MHRSATVPEQQPGPPGTRRPDGCPALALPDNRGMELAELSRDEIAALTWSWDPGSPLIGPPFPSPVLADPTFLPPDATPDGRWHLWAHSLLGVHHHTSDDGLAWKREETVARNALRPQIVDLGAGTTPRYRLLYERTRAFIPFGVPWRSWIGPRWTCGSGPIPSCSCARRCRGTGTPRRARRCPTRHWWRCPTPAGGCTSAPGWCTSRTVASTSRSTSAWPRAQARRTLRRAPRSGPRPRTGGPMGQPGGGRGGGARGQRRVGRLPEPDRMGRHDAHLELRPWCSPAPTAWTGRSPGGRSWRRRGPDGRRPTCMPWTSATPLPGFGCTPTGATPRTGRVDGSTSAWQPRIAAVRPAECLSRRRGAASRSPTARRPRRS